MISKLLNQGKDYRYSLLGSVGQLVEGRPPDVEEHPADDRHTASRHDAQAVVTSCKLCNLGGSLCVARRHHSCCCCAPRRHSDNLLLYCHKMQLHLGTLYRPIGHDLTTE